MICLWVGWKGDGRCKRRLMDDSGKGTRLGQTEMPG